MGKRGGISSFEEDEELRSTADSQSSQVKAKRKSMNKSCDCRQGRAKEAVLWSLRRRRIQPSHVSLPCIYRDYSFWESVANIANMHFGVNISVEAALGLATEMKENGCACGEVQLLFSNIIDCGPMILPQYSELIRDSSDFISNRDASHSFLLEPEVNLLGEAGTSHALVTSTPIESGPSTKKRKTNIDEVLSLFKKCPNLPRPTIYAALQKFENKGTRKMWMNDTLKNKLNFLKNVTPRKSLRDFLYWRESQEVQLLD